MMDEPIIETTALGDSVRSFYVAPRTRPGDLFPTRYHIRQSADGLMEIDVSFRTKITGSASPQVISEFLRRLGLWFTSGGVSIVKAEDRPRCFYCASLNAADSLECRKCGASL